ncbi:MAG TPA: DUF4294 domain-containing protein [Marinilabiliaceae bacterium]|nr:DUF4294 domain-containing protein [Marinilabiliaceae bacterium]
MRLLQVYTSFLIFILTLSTSLAQDSNFQVVRSRVIEGDTLPHILLDEVTIVPPWKFRSERERRNYGRLLINIKKTLPYARIAGEKLQIINDSLMHIEGDKRRRQYLRAAEKELFSEFEAPLRKLTFSQGRMLIRLMDRETGSTSYNLIKEYKGGVPAFFWQGIARLFGANLKDEYDPDKDDKMVEHIITLIDNGVL